MNHTSWTEHLRATNERAARAESRISELEAALHLVMTHAGEAKISSETIAAFLPLTEIIHVADAALRGAPASVSVSPVVGALDGEVDGEHQGKVQDLGPVLREAVEVPLQQLNGEASGVTGLAGEVKLDRVEVGHTPSIETTDPNRKANRHEMISDTDLKNEIRSLSRSKLEQLLFERIKREPPSTDVREEVQRSSDAERVPWTGLAGHEKPCSWFTPGGNCECRERRQRTKEAPPEPPFPGTRASWAATAEAFRWVLERIAADSTDDDSRTLASAILNEPEYRTDEQKSALDAMRAKLHRTWSARPTLDVDRWKQWLWVRLDAVTTHDHIAEIAEELAFEVAPTPPIDIVCGRAIIEAALHWRERVRLGLTTATALEKIEQAIDATPKVHRSETALAERKAATISDLTWNSAIDECVAVIADLIEQGCIELSDRSWDKDTILSELRSLKTTPTGSEGPK